MPVDYDLAMIRGARCSKCPMNRPVGWRDLARVGIAKAVIEQERLRRKGEMTLPMDQQLGVCDPCWCYLRLKCWVPLHCILEHSEESELQSLHHNCWILAEKARLG